MSLAAVSLDDKYTKEEGTVLLTGIQALVRLPLMQKQRDRAAGLNTAGFISGYRGSPLGGYDLQLERARQYLEAHDIHFQPGINEDLAATAVWGSQQVNAFPGAKYDGVFAIWYGKAPGLDRSCDAIRHGNLAGSSRHGGVLMVVGDDHAAKSSTIPSQSEYSFMDMGLPVLNPSGVQEVLDYGLIGWAMSRYSGCWVGLIALAETMDSTATVLTAPERPEIVIPEDFALPPDGVNLRVPDTGMEQERRLHEYKLYAALAFARANGLNRIVIDTPNPRLGIITTGKAYLDVRQALDDLGISEREASELGIRLYKIGMSWPLDMVGVRRFAEGLDQIVVIEEKRAVMENQLKEQLYNWPVAQRPRVVGKFDENRNWLLPSMGELTPAQVARVIAARLPQDFRTARMEARLAAIDSREREIAQVHSNVIRVPFFCSGCPHNTSTRLPEGSRAVAGIGCHYMVQWMGRNSEVFTQMGGEGAPWIGQAPFTEERHIFTNLGDGTYYHSGLLAIRAALAAKVNITYKILYNDAVAMTGGQPVDGPLSVPMIVDQVRAEGVEHIVVVTDEPDKYTGALKLPSDIPVEHRDRLDAVQRRLRETPGVSVLIYDQTCAAEKRRRRKRGLYPDPPKRVFINDLVCEGCGDCSVQSNCLSVEPLETEWGRKRRINQSSCNKDYSCLKGFCPSFVTVHGGRIRKAEAVPVAELEALVKDLPRPPLPELDKPYNLLVTGVGGTGVVTIGALLAMAAHIEGKGCTVVDMTGLAQKGGAVISHVRIARKPGDIHAPRIPAGEANGLLACDLVVAASPEALAKTLPEVTRAVVNTHMTPTAQFTMDNSVTFDVDSLMGLVRRATREHFDVDGTSLATALLGDAIATNMFMLGSACQLGLVPVSVEAIERAIELNGVAVDMNKQALAWGRMAVHDRARVEDIARPLIVDADEAIASALDEVVDKRAAFLTDYQDAAYAARYKALVERVRKAEADKVPGEDGLALAVARNYFKLLAYKDEYEVARLYSDPGFRRKLEAQFEGEYELQLHLAPPLLARRDPDTGHLQKRAFGPWIFPLMRLLARARGLRKTPFDPFGHTAERRAERQLIADYEAMVEEVLSGLGPDTHAIAVALASLPEDIRGFGHIKAANIETAKARQSELMKAFRKAAPQACAA